MHKASDECPACGKPYVAAKDHAACMPMPGYFASLLKFRLKAPTKEMKLLAAEFDRTVKKQTTQAEIISWTVRAQRVLRVMWFPSQCDPDVCDISHREVADAQAARLMFFCAIRQYGDAAVEACAKAAAETAAATMDDVTEAEPMAVC